MDEINKMKIIYESVYEISLFFTVTDQSVTQKSLWYHNLNFYIYKEIITKSEEMMRRIINLSLLTFLFAFNFSLLAQEEYSDETNSSVAELGQFHEVMYPIWHTAYPEKDFAALRNYSEDVKTLAEKIYSAKLPGILRDKNTNWQLGVSDFKNSIDAYLKACEGNNNQFLLDAVEEMHTKYEILVRTIRPVAKEVDAFHKVLYVIYHKYLPDKKYDKIKEMGDELKQKSEAMLTAKLSKRLEGKTEAYKEAVEKLIVSVDMLNEVLAAENSDAIDSAVELMHTNYVNIEKIFD
ncbi:MAG: hypothetical protein FJ213_11555 [Ignavibacteria bacterium]|nr:hypothetical protein [Ignavibacteria bacterium]